MGKQWADRIFLADDEGFDALALDIFRFQYHHNPVYREFADAVRVNVAEIDNPVMIPFLPVSLFRTHKIRSGSFSPEAVFESSGTTGMARAYHYVKELSIYESSFLLGFGHCYGAVRDWCILGLLPSYLERSNSSLVYMVDKLIGLSGHPLSGFYLHDHEKLSQTLAKLERDSQKTLLIGVSFALLDFAEKYPMNLRHTTVMETGGMKGRREEMTREELHERLMRGLGVELVHSEYGMTELLSQAYSRGEGRFETPPWMKVMLREEEDPMTVLSNGSGVLNIIDLANVYSCSFIATEDLGRIREDGSFEVLGRMDNSEVRGCSLMVV